MPTYPTPARSNGSRSSALRPSTNSSSPGRRAGLEATVGLVRRLQDGDPDRHAELEVVRLEAEAAQVLGVEVRVVAVDPRAGGEQLVAEAEGGAEGVLAHVAAVGDAEHEHRLTVERPEAVLDRVDREGAHRPR